MCVRMHMYMYMCVSLYMCVHVCTCLCVCVCVHVLLQGCRFTMIVIMLLSSLHFLLVF